MIKNIVTHIVSTLKGFIVLFALIFNTLFFSVSMYVVIIFKIIIPMHRYKRYCTSILVWLSECWIDVNIFVLAHMHHIQWDISGLKKLSNKKWYFLICNHQSFSDVFVLQKVLTGKIAPFKFFMKKSLIWMPVIGVAWWALDCIFMKRYSKEVLEKKPHLRDVDMKATQKKCREFKHTPVTIVNFVEGTRFTQQKHDAQQSSYQNLLNPRAGGLAYMVAAMQGQAHDVINVTIAYPNGPYNFWDFLCGRIKKIKVHVDVVPIPSILLKGDYFQDSDYRTLFKQWLILLWDDKDKLLMKMLKNNR